MAGRLLGIARHDRPKGPIETVDHAEVSVEAGIQGDYRGALKPGRNQRQVTLIAINDWNAAMKDLGDPGLNWQCGAPICWSMASDCQEKRGAGWSSMAVSCWK